VEAWIVSVPFLWALWRIGAAPACWSCLTALYSVLARPWVVLHSGFPGLLLKLSGVEDGLCSWRGGKAGRLFLSVLPVLWSGQTLLVAM
jgi:hypothetical protein